MRTNRSIVASIMALLLVATVAPGVAGQGGPVAVGTPAVWVDSSGVERGTVTVLEILDPFTDHREDHAPAEGSRYVVVTMSFEATDGDGIEVYPGYIWLRDSEGALWAEADADVPEDFPQPDLSIQTVGPGSSISGYIEYVVPADATIEQILFQPETGTLLIPADLGSARPEVGTEVPLVGAEGASAVATVSEVVDPFKAFAKERGPAAGARFVMVTGSFANTGQVPFRIERNGLVVRDVQGAVWGAASVEPAKKPKFKELDSTDLGPANKITGRLGYQVPEGVALDGVYYQGDGHLTLLASLSEPGGLTTDGALDCPAVVAWWDQVNGLLQRLVALPPFQEDTAAMDLAASRLMLAELEAIRAEHLALTPPDGLAGVHRRILGAFLLYERSALDQVAAQEADDPALVAAAGEAFEAAQLVGQDSLAVLEEAGVEDCMEG